MSPHLIPTIEPLARVSRERQNNPQNRTPGRTSMKWVDPYKDVVEFDTAYATRISELLRDKEPRKAYDYLRLTTFNDPLIQIDGYGLIYSWLHNELSITDVAEKQKWIKKQIGNIVHKFKPDNKEVFHILLQELEAELVTWFAEKMQPAGYRHRGLGFGIPQTYLDFPNKVPSDSPLFKKLHKILEESMPEESSPAIEF